MSGPCQFCGAMGYAPSMGGPSICPSCDCGNFGLATIQRQASIIADLREQLAAIASPATEGREWQPIETAPKDGTRILVWFKSPTQDPRYVLVKWDGGWQIGSFDGQGYVLSRDSQPEGWCPFTPPAIPSPPDQDAWLDKRRKNFDAGNDALDAANGVTKGSRRDYPISSTHQGAKNGD